jgi:signal transduction histidine kinase
MREVSASQVQGDAELRAARRRIIEAGDAARRRLARDLHDGAQQQIVIAVINLQRAQQKWQADPERAKELVDAALESAQMGLDTLRELAAGIHPPVLATRGLLAAIEDLAPHLPVDLRMDVTSERLDPGIEASVYFFVSEALANVMKHAHASAVSVTVSVAEGALAIDVADNGIGGARVSDESSGLVGLLDRVGALDGHLTITSPAGGGTTVHALIPLPAATLL